MAIGTAAYNERIAKGYAAEPVQQEVVDQFLASIPASATAAQKVQVAQKFAHIIRQGGPYPVKDGVRMTAASAAAIADALSN